MIKHAIDFFITFIFLPYSMILYFIVTGSLLMDFIKNWLKSRKEKSAAKNKQGDA